MKSYDLLAKYYDKLTIDQAGVKAWCDFTKAYAYGHTLLEVACGSGAITLELVKAGFKVSGFDLSSPMLAIAVTKLDGLDVALALKDMRDFAYPNQFDTIVCYNDSINYLENEADLKHLFTCVHNQLNEHGRFLFDIHTTERLEEFKDEFIEEGYIDDTPYQWSILSDENHICHAITFYLDKLPFTEQHIQTIFEKEIVKKLLDQTGFDYQVLTDFTKSEDTIGEKWFFIAKRR